jgi:hypothetical protein
LAHGLFKGCVEREHASHADEDEDAAHGTSCPYDHELAPASHPLKAGHQRAQANAVDELHQGEVEHQLGLTRLNAA